MRVALTGATGIAGDAIARHLSRRGFEVVSLGRRAPDLDIPHMRWSLGEPAETTCDAIVHCAFSHVPGRYRGGEGTDAGTFLRLNRDGTLRLFDSIPDARVVFLSSRAVYGDYPAGTRLVEEMPARPDTLYGRMKSEIETRVGERGGVSLRATGLYGPPPPGRPHKWSRLFDDFTAGRAIAPRIGTEVHVADLAAAVELCLRRGTPSVLNVSDIVLDRRDLLDLFSDTAGVHGSFPDRSDPRTTSEMASDRLRRLGWNPMGMSALRTFLVDPKYIT